MAIELFEHNQETYESIETMMESGDRVAVVQPTGTGKSFLFLKWIEENAGDAFVVVSPSNEIFNQLERYAQDTEDGIILGNTEFISYQTLNNMTDEEMSAMVVDKLILDEYHRAGAAQWGPSLQRFFDAHPELKVLGATATPIRYLDECKDMTKVLFNERLARYMSLGEAIARGILPAPTYVQVWNEDDARVQSYKERIQAISGEDEQVNLGEQFSEWKRHLEMAYGPEKMFKEHMPSSHGKFIVFCSDVEHLKLMKEKMLSWLKDVNTNVHCYVSISENADKDTQLEDFIRDQNEAAVKLLFSIDRFNEGLHVPGIDGVIMLRPTTSPIIYLQQIGRALTSNSNKSPVVFDVVNNYQNCKIVLDSGEKINVLKKEIGDYFRGKEDALEDGRDVVSGFTIFSQAIEFTALYDKIEKILYPDFDAIFSDNCDALECFIKEHNQLPGWNDKWGDIKIGRWLSREKSKAKSPSYPQDRFDRLDKLGAFKESSEDYDWKCKKSLVVAFRDKHGRFPKESDPPQDGFNMGAWVRDQKTAARKNLLSPQRFAELKEAGILDDTLDVRWENTFRHYVDCCLELGRNPGEDDERYRNLYNWRRNELRAAKKPNYPPEKLEKLQSIGFFDATHDGRWEATFSVFKDYVAKNHRLPSKRTKHNGVDVGAWFVKQLKKINDVNYPKERRDKLLSVSLVRERLCA